MRLTYVYPEDAANGDDFVVDEVDFSPSGVEIRLKLYRPSWQRVLVAADAMSYRRMRAMVRS